MKQACILALGFFDGVHLGHGALLRRTRELADRCGLSAAALTFDTHPDTLVHGTPVPLLGSAADRERLMHELYGIDRIFTLHFDRETMSQPWDDFVRRTVIAGYGAAHVVCGHDFRFGAGGQGNPRRLAELCRTLGVGCDCIPEIRMDGDTVSSTRIRSLIDQGRMEEATALLGHGHLLSGTVVKGRQLGRTLGIPTANILLPEGVLTPRHGVYAATADWGCGAHMAVVNIGSRPTVEGHRVTVEPWILDFDGDLYGKTLHLSLFRFLRPEQKFDSLEALRVEILRNAEQTREFFREGTGRPPRP
ncbi:MAG: riboflavin biosynthesis protein RibF [Oscillospiraceae bacterium]|nr:riboflavin biosynthesis protein RibF [Oscillospiraceae bacterium]